MDFLSFKTNSKNKINYNKKWVIIDANNQYLGRLASKISLIIRGKHKSYFSPNIDCGDYVIVINSTKIKLSGKKWMQKKYIYYTGYPGGQKIISIKDLFKKNPNKLLYKSVKGMLPKNRLSQKIIKNLHIYQKEKHNHKAQKPFLIKN
ncbi:50S ribosomal protein L13 [Blattabacterium cuenoti]|uniref:50S ribosomal protein L13 n=1 Tax=Blattabacterium cuenoti TaxID=1653831 RepID=UPI00163CB9C9|nr:50S ribosomal protein L13 [Blattabacterium cuenoti]